MATPYRDRIETKLTAAFSPLHLVIQDDSHRHAGHRPQGEGHAPVGGDGETHFLVEIAATAFRGKSRVDRQRMVYDVLETELKEHVHALALRCLSPEEAP